MRFITLIQTALLSLTFIFFLNLAHAQDADDLLKELEAEIESLEAEKKNSSQKSKKKKRSKKKKKKKKKKKSKKTARKAKTSKGKPKKSSKAENVALKKSQLEAPPEKPGKDLKSKRTQPGEKVRENANKKKLIKNKRLKGGTQKAQVQKPKPAFASPPPGPKSGKSKAGQKKSKSQKKRLLKNSDNDLSNKSNQSKTETGYQTIKIEWFQPELQAAPKLNRTRVLLSGRTDPGVQIIIHKKSFPITRKGKVFFITRKSSLVSPPVVTVPEDGLFQIIVDLPVASVPLPIKLIPVKGEPQRYLLNLKVSSHRVRLAQKNSKRSPLFYKRYEIWLGSGFNYLNYSRKGTDTGQDLSFESFKSPSFYTEARIRATEQMDLYITGKSSPGQVSSSENISIDKGEYSWNTFSLEAGYTPKSWNMSFGSFKTAFSYRGGFQYHSIPFLKREDQSTSIISLTNTNLSMLSAGGKIQISRSYSWLFESFLRMQIPIGAGFDVSNALSFDGSLGVIYRTLGSWNTGIFWYGQLQSYDFNFNVGQDSFSGSQSLLFSNVELRIGYEFN